MENWILESLKHYSIGVAESRNNKCEIAIHDMTKPSLDNSILFIVNGEITGRSVGDGMLHQIKTALKSEPAPLKNVLHYEVKLQNGKALDCTLICVYNQKGMLEAIVSINEER